VLVVGRVRAEEVSCGAALPRTWSSRIQPAYGETVTRCAALAAAGWGEDVPKPVQEERARLRGQALEWLRADLAALQKQLASANADDRLMAQRTLYRLQRDFRFFAVREKEELAKLQDAERVAWEKLWADTEALRVSSRPAR
jgi:hypothetical protein